MEVDAEAFKEKINCYFRGEISRRSLGEWANMAYYDILRGGYIETKKIVVYPFLKIVSTFHIEENDKEDVFPCSEEDVKKVRDILNGVRDFDFEIEMSIPLQVYHMYKDKQYYDADRRELFVKLRSEVIQCFEQGSRLGDDEWLCLKKVICRNNSARTIQDVLKRHIWLLLKNLFIDDFVEICDKERTSFRLYAQNSDNNLIFERLIHCIDSYIGYRNFHLCVSFKKGMPQFSILV